MPVNLPELVPAGVKSFEWYCCPETDNCASNEHAAASVGRSTRPTEATRLGRYFRLLEAGSVEAAENVFVNEVFMSVIIELGLFLFVHQIWKGAVGTVMMPPELLLIVTLPGSKPM